MNRGGGAGGRRESSQVSAAALAKVLSNYGAGAPVRRSQLSLAQQGSASGASTVHTASFASAVRSQRLLAEHNPSELQPGTRAPPATPMAESLAETPRLPSDPMALSSEELAASLPGLTKAAVSLADIADPAQENWMEDRPHNEQPSHGAQRSTRPATKGVGAARVTMQHRRAVRVVGHRPLLCCQLTMSCPAEEATAHAHTARYHPVLLDPERDASR